MDNMLARADALAFQARIFLRSRDVIGSQRGRLVLGDRFLVTAIRPNQLRIEDVTSEVDFEPSVSEVSTLGVEVFISDGVRQYESWMGKEVVEQSASHFDEIRSHSGITQLIGIDFLFSEQFRGFEATPSDAWELTPSHAAEVNAIVLRRSQYEAGDCRMQLLYISVASGTPIRLSHFFPELPGGFEEVMRVDYSHWDVGQDPDDALFLIPDA